MFATKNPMRSFGSHRPVLVALGLASSCAIAACAMRTNILEVPGNDFVQYYQQPRTTLEHMDYAGVIEGYHYLDVFGIGLADWPHYRYSIRCSTTELSSGFPERPQSRILKEQLGTTERTPVVDPWPEADNPGFTRRFRRIPTRAPTDTQPTR